MDTGKSIILAATIIAAVGAGTAWTIQPRYSLTNVGGGSSIRLNKSNGDMVGCHGLSCAPLSSGGALVDPYGGDPIVENASLPGR